MKKRIIGMSLGLKKKRKFGRRTCKNSLMKLKTLKILNKQQDEKELICRCLPSKKAFSLPFLLHQSYFLLFLLWASWPLFSDLAFRLRIALLVLIMIWYTISNLDIWILLGKLNHGQVVFLLGRSARCYIRKPFFSRIWLKFLLILQLAWQRNLNKVRLVNGTKPNHLKNSK